MTTRAEGRGTGSLSENYLFGDAHTHLDQYGPEDIPGILIQRAAEAGIGFIVNALDGTSK